jgi:predicted metal-dependent hydrolase
MDHVEIDKLVRSRRRTIALIVNADATLTVRAPVNTPLDYIEKLVYRKSRWINEKVATIQSRPHAPSKRFVSGESFFYLGDPYRLRIVSEAATPLEFREEFILNREHHNEARNLLTTWYREQAESIIPKRVMWHAHRAGIQFGKVRITNARKCWGSCGHRNNLNFSWRLIVLPLRVVDYVVVHELAHILEKNHSRAFWRKVAVMCPRYKATIEWLRNNGQLLQV